MAFFPARYHGRCSDCETTIEPGDLISYNDFDEIICEDCYVDETDFS